VTKVAAGVVRATVRLMVATVSVAVGAGAAYLLHPTRGAARRRAVVARIRERAGSRPGSAPTVGTPSPAVVMPALSLAAEAGDPPALSDAFGRPDDA
jgi:hypothetical protein